MITQTATVAGIPGLARGEVYLRTVRLDRPATAYAPLAAVLSSDERERADRFMFDRDRRAFVICRGALRLALAAWLDVPPDSLTFTYGAHGKPSLPAYPDVRFNVSHAGSVGVLAFSRGIDVGVDVECRDRRVDVEELASRFFSVEEAAELLALPAHLRRDAFFHCWTRKEAYVKAVGDGLACPLDSFAVTLRPGDAARFTWIANDDAARWTLQALRVAANYIGAVAVPAANVAIDGVTSEGIEPLLVVEDGGTK